MHRRGGKYGRIHHYLAAGAAAAALSAGTAGGAHAQAAPAQSGATVRFDIAQGDLSKSLTQLGRQAGVQIAFLPDGVRGRRAGAIRGTFTVEQALDRLLAGTGLHYQRTPRGSYVVGSSNVEANEPTDRAATEGRDAEGIATRPDILVVGKRDWNLNLDIPRTADDAQPYVVFSREEIKRSGATSLEDFFRDNLGANVTGSNSTQVGGSQSVINLRGLGPTGTLILVDGRRYSQANVGDGVFTQSSVNGIPLDAIERIEVLASSASGIYGSNAVGGVINIILRRNYSGIEATAYYGNTTRIDASEKRLSLNGNLPLEGGRTRVSFSASWQQTSALYEGDRDFIVRGRALLLANNPNYFNTITSPVVGATPNIVSSNGSNLVLKAQYGGTALGSRSTFVPVGFRGIVQDGVAALVANAGKQNFDLAPSVLFSSGGNGNGALSTLLTPTKSYNASLTVRRDFNKWLSLYGEFGYSHYVTNLLSNPAAGTYTLPASSIDNPFTTAIQISLPVSAGNVLTAVRTTNKRALAGAIVRLPVGWQAAIDLTWNWNRYGGVNALPGFDQATLTGIQTGTLSVVKDVNQYPVPFTYLDRSAGGTLRPSSAYSRSYTLKLNGPLPLLRLGGGKPVVTLLAEQDKQNQGEYVSFVNQAGGNGSTITFTPARSQRVDSAYGEVRFPIIGGDNHVPLIRELDLQVAGRYDRYVGVGANALLNCYPGLSIRSPGPLPASAYNAPCPQAGARPVFETTRNHSINNTIALRWAVLQDITFRGSYSTGYLPPLLNSIVPVAAGAPGTLLAGKALVNVTDPLRGNTRIGTDIFPPFGLFGLPATQGGNPNIDPQLSKSLSFGGILTPRFLPGLRLSVDWSRIVERNVYFSPALLLGGFGTATAQQQRAFNDFLAAHPERFPRSTDPATFGSFGVGPIISADLTTANFSFLRTQSIDFAGSYDASLGKGHLTLQGAATWFRDSTVQLQPSSAPIQSAGVVPNSFLYFLASSGGAAWKGNGSIVYSTDRWSLGFKGRYVSPYWLNTGHTVDPLQGSAKIGAQAYFDIFGAFKILRRTELRGGVNNVFDRSPPINASTNTFYSFYGDPRRANFYLSVNQKF